MERDWEQENPWDSPGKNTGVDCHALLQGIFPTQDSNLHLLSLLHFRWILYPWAAREAPLNNNTNVYCSGFPDGSGVKKSIHSAGDAGDTASIPGSGRPPGEANDNPLQRSCLENPMDREAWWAYSPRGHKRLGHDWVCIHSLFINAYLLSIFCALVPPHPALSMVLLFMVLVTLDPEILNEKIQKFLNFIFWILFNLKRKPFSCAGSSLLSGLFSRCWGWVSSSPHCSVLLQRSTGSRSVGVSSHSLGAQHLQLLGSGTQAQ